MARGGIEPPTQGFSILRAESATEGLSAELRRAVKAAVYSALSGYAQEAGRARTIVAGLDAQLVKPVGLAALLATVLWPPVRLLRRR